MAEASSQNNAPTRAIRARLEPTTPAVGPPGMSRSTAIGLTRLRRTMGRMANMPVVATPMPTPARITSGLSTKLMSTLATFWTRRRTASESPIPAAAPATPPISPKRAASRPNST